MSTYMKAIVAVLTGISTWGVTAVADGHVDAVELFGLLGVVAAGLGVYSARNAPDPVDPGDAGHSDVELVMLAATCIGVILLVFGVTIR